MCPDLVDMLEHQGSPSVSIPCSSFHHCSAMRAAEATTMVLLWAKILRVQLDSPTTGSFHCLIHRGDGSCPGCCGLMPAVKEGFLQLSLSFLTGTMSGAAPVAEGQGQGSPAPLSLPLSAATALLLALGINEVAPVVTRPIPAAERVTAPLASPARPDPAPSLL